MSDYADLPDPAEPIAEEAEVYRLISCLHCEVRDGAWEFQSSAFDNASPLYDGDSPDDMSVVLSDTLAAMRRRPEDLPTEGAPEITGPNWGVAVLQVRFLRGELQEILRTPSAEEPAHGDVRGTKNRARRRRFKSHARWLARPAADPNA